MVQIWASKGVPSGLVIGLLACGSVDTETTNVVGRSGCGIVLLVATPHPKACVTPESVVTPDVIGLGYCCWAVWSVPQVSNKVIRILKREIRLLRSNLIRMVFNQMKDNSLMFITEDHRNIDLLF